MAKSTNNQFLQGNGVFIEKIIRQCTEYYMKGSYGGAIPLNSIIRLFNGMVIEIEKLQEEINLLKQEQLLKIKEG